MLTLALYGLLAIGLMGALFLLAVRFLPAGEQIAAPVRDEPVWTLPAERKLTASDIADLRLPVSLRGYRFAETDELLDRLVEELRSRDAELDRVYGLLIAAGIPREPAAAAVDPGGDAHTHTDTLTPTDTPTPTDTRIHADTPLPGSATDEHAG